MSSVPREQGTLLDDLGWREQRLTQLATPVSEPVSAATQQLSAEDLADAVLAMAGTDSTPALARAAVEHTRRLVSGASAASLAIRDRRRLRLLAVTDAGLVEHDLEPLEQWPWSEQAADQLDWRLPDHAVRSVRLRLGDQTCGVLSAMASSSGELTDQTAAALRVVGSAVAAALAAGIAQETLQQALHSHRFIGQAVRILVERRRVTPTEAFGLLTKQSQNHNIKLYDLAQQVVATGRDPEDILSI